MSSIEKRAHQWIVGCDTGMSSKAIWAHMIGAGAPGFGGWSYPSDPADLGRCLRLLRAVPEWAPRLPEMAKRSPQWARLVEAWEEIVACMEDEVGWDWSKGRSAPKTYELMKNVLGHRV